MPPKWDRSGATLIEKPWSVTQRFTRTPERGDLGLGRAVADPDADAARARGARRRRDRPSVSMIQPSSAWTKQRTSRPRLLEVEHHIADALARAVIGVAPAAPGLVDREAERVDQLGRVGAGAGGEQGRMFEQPDAFARGAGADRRGALLHEGERLGIGHGPVADPPFDFARIVHWPREMAPARGRRQARLRGPTKLSISTADQSERDENGRIVDFEGVGRDQAGDRPRRQLADDDRAGAVRACRA